MLWVNVVNMYTDCFFNFARTSGKNPMEFFNQNFIEIGKKWLSFGKPTYPDCFLGPPQWGARERPCCCLSQVDSTLAVTWSACCTGLASQTRQSGDIAVKNGGNLRSILLRKITIFTISERKYDSTIQYYISASGKWYVVDEMLDNNK